MYVELLTSHGLAVERWEAGIAEEYIGMLWMKNLMGASADAPVQVNMDLTKNAGDAMTIGIRSQMIGGYVSGNNKGIGQEGKVNFFSFRHVVDNERHLIKFWDVPLSQQRAMFNILQSGRNALVEKAQIRLDEDIINALAVTSSGRVRGRYLYGSLDSNWNATHSTAEANVDNTDDKLTTSMIRIAKRKALLTQGNAQTKIRPMKVKIGQNYEEHFIFIAHPFAIRDLVDGDAAYRNAQLLLPPSMNAESPLYTGSSFKGQYDGVLIYEYDRMPIDSAAGAASIDVAHNFLLGAQAAVVSWAQMPKFGEEFEDLKHNVSYELHEIRGVDKIVYDRNSVDGTSNEDNGVVHVFSAAVAD